MSEIRQHIDVAIPRQRQAGGVVGYVAELQQFDAAMTQPPASAEPGESSAAAEAPADTEAAIAVDPIAVDAIAADPTAVDAIAIAADPIAVDPIAEATAVEHGAGEPAFGESADVEAPVGAGPPAAPEFAGGSVATASFADDATVEFLLGWVDDSPAPAGDHAETPPPRAVRPSTEVVPVALAGAATAAAASTMVQAGTAWSPSTALQSRTASAPSTAVQASMVSAPSTAVPANSAWAVTADASGSTATSVRASRRRRRRAELTSLALVGIATAGLLYASYDRSAPRQIGLPPPVQVPTTTPPETGPPFSSGALPGIAAIPSRSGASSSPTAGTSTSPTPGDSTSPSADEDRVLHGRPEWPIPPTRGWSMPPTTPAGTHSPSAPASSNPPAPVPPAPPSVPPIRLAATFSVTADGLPLGLSGYVGTVRIDNPGGVDVADWRVSLTVPGGNAVTDTGDADVMQDGDYVVFGPGYGMSVPAGGSLTFTFSVHGLLPGEPSHCMIDGRACATG